MKTLQLAAIKRAINDALGEVRGAQDDRPEWRGPLLITATNNLLGKLDKIGKQLRDFRSAPGKGVHGRPVKVGCRM